MEKGRGIGDQKGRDKHDTFFKDGGAETPGGTEKQRPVGMRKKIIDRRCSGTPGEAPGCRVPCA
jgi:hypothetical protein